MYQIKSIHDKQSFVYSLSDDEERLVGIFITDSERESFGRFQPETRQQLVDRYLEGIGNGTTDGSDELFQYLADGLSVPPTKIKRYLGSIKRIFTNRVVLSQGETTATNIICEERSGLISLKLGNVSIGEIVYQKPEFIQQIEEEPEEIEEIKPEEIEAEEEMVEEEKVEENAEETLEKEGDSDEEGKNGDSNPPDPPVITPARQPWWNISRPVFILLILLLAAVAFFVTLLLTGKISLGNKGGNTQKTELTDTTQVGREQSDTASTKLTKEQILELAKYQEELARVKSADARYGFADKAGKVVIPCQWTDAHSFHQGLAVVKDQSGMWGYIDKKGKLVIPCKWKEASDFDASGTASVVNKYNEHFKIDKNGAIMRNTDNSKTHQH